MARVRHDRLVARPGLTFLTLGQAAFDAVAPALRLPPGDLDDLQVELDGRAVAPRTTGASWQAARSDGASIAHAVLRYGLSGVFVRSTPAPPGRFTVVLRPLLAATVLGSGDPVVVRSRDEFVTLS